MNGNHERFRELVDAARRSDPTARAELVEVLYPRVSRLVHAELQGEFRQSQRWILPLFSTGDIVHEVLTQLCCELDVFRDRDEGEVAVYLARVVHHRLLDALRHHRADRRDARRHVAGVGEDVVPQDRGSGPGTLADFAEQFSVFQQVLATFSPRHRTLLEARMLDHASFPSLAERLGYASPDVARKLFHEVHARLLLQLRARGVRPPGDSVS